MPANLTARFSPGRIVIAPAAMRLLSAEDIKLGLQAHVAGEWGDLGREDREENERALAHGHRLLSVYHNRAGVKFWVITEADRSVTNILSRETHPGRETSPLFGSRAKTLVRQLNKLTAKSMAGAPAVKLRFCVR